MEIKIKGSYHSDDHRQPQPDFQMQSLSEMMLRWDALEIVFTGIEEVTQQSIFGRIRQNHCTHQTK